MKKYIVLLVFLIVFGCSGCMKKDTKQEESAIEPSFEIAVFKGGTGANQWKRLVDAFQEKYPSVEIELIANAKVGQILKPRIISGDAPDFIVMMDENTSGLMEMMIEEELLMDLTAVFENAKDHEVPLKEKILPEYLNSPKFMPYRDGKIYLAPLESGPRGLVYNRDLFEKRDWKVPETWDEFFELGEKAKKEGRYLFTYPGIYGKYLTNLLIPVIADHAGYGAVEDIFHYKENSFSNQKVLEVLKQVERIYQGGYLLPETLSLNHLQAQQMVLDGKALFIPTGPWIEQEMKGADREAGFSYGMAAPPRFEEDTEKYIVANYGQACIPKNAKNPNIAKEFLKFLYSDEAVKIIAEESNSIMATKNGTEIAKPFISEDMYEMMQLTHEAKPILIDFEIPPETSVLSVKDELYIEGGTQLFNGDIQAIEWAENMERLFAQIREEYKLRK